MLFYEIKDVRFYQFIPKIDALPSEMHLPRRSWVRLNRLRTGDGRFLSFLHNWGMATTAACKCGAENQTADHITADCLLYSPFHGTAARLIRLDEDTTSWLQETYLNI